MPPKVDVDKPQEAIREGRYTATQHLRQRKARRKIRWKEILDVIEYGETIEEAPTAQPFPKILLMKMVRQDEPLYVSTAYDAEEHWAHIITVHWYDPSKWTDPWTRRR